MSHQNISDGLVVGLHYTLKNDGDEVLDTSEEREPLEYLHGAHNIVPGLEKALTGMAIGDAFDVVIEPEDGYGTRQEGATETIAKDRLPEEMLVFPGMQLNAQDEDGQVYAMWVSEVGDEDITVDFNHPLAGERLHFSGKIISLRDASEEEKTHGHVHGPGHAHE
jgi:FKBP-type peptidyl-prolyl cis-trans isomerase SlyD